MSSTGGGSPSRPSLRSAAGRLRSDSRMRVATPIGQSTDDADAVGPEILGERLREADHRVLRGVVDAEPLAGDQSGHGGGVDDVAALAAGDHARDERLDAVDHAPEVHAEDPLPVAMGGRPRGRPGAADAGVVAEDVHGAEARERLLGQRPAPARDR